MEIGLEMYAAPLLVAMMPLKELILGILAIAFFYWLLRGNDKNEHILRGFYVIAAFVVLAIVATIWSHFN